jgi:sulfatase maturation enzyme AslB (radical SAM superfamily)
MAVMPDSSLTRMDRGEISDMGTSFLSSFFINGLEKSRLDKRICFWQTCPVKERRRFMHEFTMDLGRVCLEEKADLAYLYLEISNRCNLNCKMCFKQSWMDAEGDMEMGLFEKILNDAEEFPDLKMIYFGGIGEPLVHPEFMEMVRAVRKRGISVGVSTNGFLMTDEIMKEFIDLQVDLVYFSMDVIPMMPTEVGHPISEDTVGKLGRFRDLKNERGSDLPHIGVESVITKENYHQLAELADFLTNFEIQAMIFSNLLPSTEAFADLIAYDGYLYNTGLWVVQRVKEKIFL